MSSPLYSPPLATMPAPPLPPIQRPPASGAPRIALITIVGIAMVTALTISLISTAGVARKNAYPPPVVAIDSSATSTSRVNDPISFNAAAAAGRDLTYRWDFGDGVTATGSAVQHAYTQYAQGGYTVTLIATDPLEQQVTVQKTVTVLPQAPTASFTYSTDPSGPLTIDFDASASTGSGLSFQWDFGDGNTGQGQQTSNTYANVGSYQVQLVVTDVAGQTAGTSETVSVQIAGPSASFTATQTYNDGYGDACYTFDASASSGYQLSYAWDFGDGNSDPYGSAQESHCYYGSGNYTVRLTVSDGLNRSASTSHGVSF